MTKLDRTTNSHEFFFGSVVLDLLWVNFHNILKNIQQWFVWGYNVIFVNDLNLELGIV